MPGRRARGGSRVRPRDRDPGGVRRGRGRCRRGGCDRHGPCPLIARTGARSKALPPGDVRGGDRLSLSGRAACGSRGAVRRARPPRTRDSMPQAHALSSPPRAGASDLPRHGRRRAPGSPFARRGRLRDPGAGRPPLASSCDGRRCGLRRTQRVRRGGRCGLHRAGRRGVGRGRGTSGGRGWAGPRASAGRRRGHALARCGAAADPARSSPAWRAPRCRGGDPRPPRGRRRAAGRGGRARLRTKHRSTWARGIGRRATPRSCPRRRSGLRGRPRPQEGARRKSKARRRCAGVHRQRSRSRIDRARGRGAGLRPLRELRVGPGACSSSAITSLRGALRGQRLLPW